MWDKFDNFISHQNLPNYDNILQKEKNCGTKKS